MKISLVFAVSLAIAALSIASANADNRRPPPTGGIAVASGPGCGSGVWPAFGTCKNVFKYKTYSDCHADAMKMSWRGNDIWWYCSSLGLKD
ncbi:hypothetical protein ACVWZ6_001443 [Bradyrhizobium sp. GM6.1]